VGERDLSPDCVESVAHFDLSRFIRRDAEDRRNEHFESGFYGEFYDGFNMTEKISEK